MFISKFILAIAICECFTLAHLDDMSPGPGRIESVRLAGLPIANQNQDLRKRSGGEEEEEEVVPISLLVFAPHITPGPYFGPLADFANNADLRAEALGRAAVLYGVPLTLTLNVYAVANGTGTAMAGASVFLWHCDSLGVYGGVSLASAPSNRENTVGQRWLRSVQPTNDAGQVVFHTIVPGAYAGRTLHFHLRVRAADAETDSTFAVTTQLMFRDSVYARLATVEPYKSVSTPYVTLAQDSIYRSAAAAVGDGLLLDLNGSPATERHSTSASNAQWKITTVIWEVWLGRRMPLSPSR